MGRAEQALTVAPGLAAPWWLQDAPLDPEQPPLEGDARADVAIVGAGFTGLWTALELKRREPALDVVVLEAARCGIGPSGRNGGFLHGYWSSLARFRDVLGADGRAGGRTRSRTVRSRPCAPSTRTCGCVRAG